MRDHDDPAIRISDLPPRDGGYVDLRSYAAIGDGRTVALIAHDGSVDWYPMPNLDSPPVFARLLDSENGGCFELYPAQTHTVTRQYIPGTNVLQTTYQTRTGKVCVTDSLNTGKSGRLPWGEFARRIDGLEGTMELRWRVAPGTRLNRVSPWADNTRQCPLLRVGDVTLGVIGCSGEELNFSDRTVSGTISVDAGQRRLIALISTRHEPLPCPDPEHILDGIERTVSYWESWSSELHYDGPWSGEVLRSALALKVLTHSLSGAIAAAATTSLPEDPRGGKNWDYRFAWIRDAAYTLHALIRFGEREEVHSAVSWLLTMIRKQGPDPEVFSTLGGELPQSEHEVDAPGWRGIGPVIEGNRVGGQLQLGVYGDLFDMIDLYLEGGNVIDQPTARLLADIADRTCDVWHQRDAGIWELTEARHYTSSKMGCWHALECAVRLAESGQIEGEAARWQTERDRIKQWILENCWSDERQSYVWYAGSNDLDASVLIHAMSGFDRSERMSTTIDAVRKELGDGPLIYRYTGMQREEGAFVACSFWMVAALAEVGRKAEAERLMAQMVPLANDVGLYAEMIHPEDNRFLGNLPQGLSHLALMTAALTLIEKY
ncbi:glycoside hydrolase family 15 protein [Hoyosella altamirensis]|uniref:GH15 family glucan-1,4-alpha-glucosidase n=1 Tax=Hoyosella altamirensis TaxID=616997 RepID=A0A839RP54_9ACTN|nr:glycoside hydrolase family 15 protein [Hoyosella altamirensis]MBB3038782.1 GH15 family glucan-1,4-alpha-glucosidase [Hoyosella altamirensis]